MQTSCLLMETGSRRPLGEILLEQGVLNRAQLRVGLVHHHEVHVPLGRALVREGLCSGADVLRGLAEQFGVDAVDLERTPPDSRRLNHIPARVARQYRVVPLRIDKVLLDQGEREVLHIALPAPVSLDAVDAVRAVSGMPRVEAHIASDAALARALADLYGIETPAEPPMPPSLAPGGPLLLYGWSPVTAVLITRLLARNGLQARTATPLEVLHTGPEDVVLAPLQAMEGLLAGEVHIKGALIVHGSDDESFDRVRELGARGFLASPRDEELLLRAVRRLRPHPGSPDSAPPSH
ncbi:general secretion pathway protein E, N-terminal domain protein [Myxococcus xanthus DK 1622]|uniref:General secretion pathway protein E, N-terminal domain protein n=2 Tax=Myxococcaceae TaxID=31 RepID=Q1D133_MYXXD|nr:general secretion pathway protein E, N-terminal domain protein [Myxococcus xanthus DK 1622]NOJ55469.1 general secretion pathway protein GspE [Myxococcus xanthus]QPM77936.1 general secretion pathway protein GspE [Myxococcus xanthus]QVW67004.1 general secretion pathway protein GspE [Myxococcus xanthus DZ2]UEO06869.1 general secretion pathway protein GspE [Myxococcus xanthus DZ2]